MINKTEIKVRVTFMEEVLGTANNNPDIHSEFIASKAPDATTREEEIEALGVDAVVDKAMTIFPKMEDGTPFFWDYQWKGFFKDACGMLKRSKGTLSSKIKAYKKEIDGNIFIKERRIPINMAGEMGACQRPLRAQTMQGERVSLANSETVPSGSTCEFTIVLLCPEHEAVVMEWLEYGELRGTGQWRNSGKGRFTFEVLK